MSAGPELRTARLLMRRWREADVRPFAKLNVAPEVVELLGPPMSLGETRAWVQRIEAGFDQAGFGWWALELPGEAPFIGMAGIAPVRPELPFGEAVEIGWRLAPPFWGRGLATEAGVAAARFGLGELGLGTLLAYTARVNHRSRAVMERLGMGHEEQRDFMHPGFPAEHRLAAHVLYRLDAGTPAAAHILDATCAGATRTPPGPKN